jgi:hypothetical protein
LNPNKKINFSYSPALRNGSCVSSVQGLIKVLYNTNIMRSNLMIIVAYVFGGVIACSIAGYVIGALS